MTKVSKAGNRSRRLAAKLREILLGVKDREQQIQAVLANEELSAEAREALAAKLREAVCAARVRANRISTRKQELAYEDRRPATSVRNHVRTFPTHTMQYTDEKSHPLRWVRISRRGASAVRAFFAVQEAYAAR